MRVSTGLLIGTILAATCPLAQAQPAADTRKPEQLAREINIGFNGPSSQFRWADKFFRATNQFYRSIGRESMPGNRHCHAYLSWDVAQQPQGSGPSGIEGSRSWFEAWLEQAHGQCDEALITFKYVKGVTTTPGLPLSAAYESAMRTFVGTDWSYTGWNGKFDYTAWNEPNNGSRSGDGLTAKVPPEQAADYYLALRSTCEPTHCRVAAGDMGSNGNMWRDYVEHCPNQLHPALCPDASYLDRYKYYLAQDAPQFGLGANFRPELFSYHGWDDVNNYINSSSPCADPEQCTIRALVHSLSGAGWEKSVLWDTEVGAGQDPQSNPSAALQACAASFLLRLTANVTDRVERIYYTRAYQANGEYWSLYEHDGRPKPAFQVLARRNIAYEPARGQSCPAGGD